MGRTGIRTELTLNAVARERGYAMKTDWVMAVPIRFMVRFAIIAASRLATVHRPIGEMIGHTVLYPRKSRNECTVSTDM